MKKKIDEIAQNDSKLNKAKESFFAKQKRIESENLQSLVDQWRQNKHRW